MTMVTSRHSFLTSLVNILKVVLELREKLLTQKILLLPDLTERVR
jgi:hypothetical protein